MYSSKKETQYMLTKRLQNKVKSFQQKYHNEKENEVSNKIEKPQKMQSVHEKLQQESVFLKGIDNFVYKENVQKQQIEEEINYREKNVADHFNNYWQKRTEKFNQQVGDVGIYSGMQFLQQGKTLQKDGTVKQIFKNLTFYFNGRFEVDSSLHHDSERKIHFPSDMYTYFHLCRITKMHGATVLPCIVKKKITHVICNHFSASKQMNVNASLSKTKANEAKVFYVSADFIFACIKEGKLVAEHNFLIDTTNFYCSLDALLQSKHDLNT